MSRFTSQWYQAQLAKESAMGPAIQSTKPVQAVKDEAQLHQQILDECRSRGWIAFHGSMANRTFRTEGEPDFVILAGERVLLVECKSEKGKLSPAQLAIQAWARKLGHTIHVVRSLEEFLQLI